MKIISLSEISMQIIYYTDENLFHAAYIQTRYL
jgi:hypothetical protein